jgi:hypothetical protein
MDDDFYEATPERRFRWRHWGHRAALGLVLVGVAGLLIYLLLQAMSPEQPRPVSRGNSAASPTDSAAEPAVTNPHPTPTPSSRGPIDPDPRAVTLKATDLPAGYHVLREGQASFSPGAGGPASPSWDVVFQADAGQHADYRLIESVVIVYLSAAQATASLDSQASSERAARAIELPSAGGLGDQGLAWEESPPDGSDSAIVRVTWQSAAVVGQVSVLGRSGPSLQAQAMHLAITQQSAIRAAQT